MLDTIVLGIFVFILSLGIVGAFVSRRSRDRCLKDFQGFKTTVLQKGGKRIWGRLVVETSGIEFCYAGNYWDQDHQDHIETSYVMYKDDFGTIYILLRYHDELSKEERQKRLRAIEKAYRPALHRRMVRHVKNTFNSLRDSMVEAGNVLIQIRAESQALRTVATQQRVAATSIAGTSYDPLLERHIGTMVVVEVTSADGTVDEYIGIFKEYSTQFLEVMDVHVHEGESSRMCDLIVPRAHSVVRHSAEPVASPLPNPEAPVPAG